MINSSSKGVVLRHLGGEGPIEVMTRLTDFNLQEVTGPGGNQVEVPTNSLVAFTALSFRELGDSDEWEFSVLAPSKVGQVKAYIYLSGKDIFLIRAQSKVG